MDLAWHHVNEIAFVEIFDIFETDKDWKSLLVFFKILNFFNFEIIYVG